MIRTLLIPLVFLAAPLASAVPPATAPAAASEIAPERADAVPPELAAAGVTEHLNQRLPLDALLCDEQGRPVHLRDYFPGDKPVILNFGYYECPMLCGVVINGLVDALKALSYTPGREFRIVTVSINPAEKFPLAAAKKRNVMAALGKPEAAAGWSFLTGDEDQVRPLAEAAGFGYRWDPAAHQFAHSAVLILCTPDGRVSRYLYGVQYPADILRLSLVEASEGKVGSTVDKIILYCFHYDPSRGSYTLAAMNLMRAGGGLTVLILAIVIGAALRRERRRRRGAAAGAHASSPTAPEPR